MLVDSEGNPLETEEQKRQRVKDILEGVKPRSKEEEALLAKKVGEAIEKRRKGDINKKIEVGFNGLFKENTEERVKGDGFTQGRNY